MRRTRKPPGRLRGGLSRFRREYFGTKQDIAWGLVSAFIGLAGGVLFSALWIR